MKKEKRQTNKSIRFFLFILLMFSCSMFYYYLHQDDYESFFKQDSEIKRQNQTMPTEVRCQVKMNWQKGARQLYRLDIVKTDQTYPSALEDHSGNKNNYALQIHMEIRSILNVRIFGKNQGDDFVYMGCQLSNVVVRAGDSSETLSRDEDIETQFRPFFLVAFNLNGVPQQFYFPPHLDSQSRSSLSEVIFAIQTVVPSHSDHSHLRKWRSQEQHAFGKFKVEYMLEPHSCKALIKQNIRCTALNELDHSILKTDQFQFRGIVEHSNHQITLADEGASWIHSYAGEETFAIYVSQHAVWYRRHTKILLTPDLQSMDPDLFIWETNLPVNEIIELFGGDEKKIKDSRKSRGKKFSERMALSSQLEMFQKDILENASQDVILGHIHNLEHFLVKFPEEAGFIPDLIKNLNIQGRAAENIILILEMVGHEDAQSAISDIFLDYNQDPDIRLKAAVSAGGIASPKPILIDRLFQLISQEQEISDIQELNRSDAAILSLGLINQTLYAAKNSVSANFIHNRLIGMLQNYSDERHMNACIKALGNAKMPEGIDYLLPFIDSDVTIIRKSAIQAIGKLDVQADEDHAFSESGPELESEIETSSSDSLTANVSVKLIHQFYNEQNPEIRQEIIKAVIHRKEQGVLNVLDDILHEETDEVILDMIQSYLQMN